MDSFKRQYSASFFHSCHVYFDMNQQEFIKFINPCPLIPDLYPLSTVMPPWFVWPVPSAAKTLTHVSICYPMMGIALIGDLLRDDSRPQWHLECQGEDDNVEYPDSQLRSSFDWTVQAPVMPSAHCCHLKDKTPSQPGSHSSVRTPSFVWARYSWDAYFLIRLRPRKWDSWNMSHSIWSV